MLQNVTGMKELPEEGADERRNASECLSNSVTWCLRGGALSVGLMKTNKYEHNALHIQH